MNHASGSPFDSIESAHDFVGLYAESVADAKREIERDLERELTSKAPRRLDALRLAAYNLEKLELHLTKSRRILNDLRSLRRLLFEERAAAGRPASAKPPQKASPEAPATKPELVSRPLLPRLPASQRRGNGSASANIAAD